MRAYLHACMACMRARTSCRYLCMSRGAVMWCDVVRCVVRRLVYVHACTHACKTRMAYVCMIVCVSACISACIACARACTNARMRVIFAL